MFQIPSVFFTLPSCQNPSENVKIQAIQTQDDKVAYVQARLLSTLLREGQVSYIVIPRTACVTISRIHSCLFSDWRRTVSSKYFDTQVPSISTEELVLPRHACCVLSRLRCNGHSLLLGSYLSRIGRIENPFYGACEYSSQDTSHLILHCPATLRRSLFGDSLFLYDLLSRPWRGARLLGLHGLPPCPHPSEGIG